jgi:hypothetical protein
VLASLGVVMALSCSCSSGLHRNPENARDTLRPDLASRARRRAGAPLGSKWMVARERDGHRFPVGAARTPADARVLAIAAAARERRGCSISGRCGSAWGSLLRPASTAK